VEKGYQVLKHSQWKHPSCYSGGWWCSYIQVW